MASLSLSPEALPALAQATSALLQKLTQSLALTGTQATSAATEAVSGALDTNGPVMLQGTAFDECLQLLATHPDLVLPVPLFLASKYEPWRYLPTVSLSSFSENKRALSIPLDTIDCDKRMDSTINSTLVRRALGVYATKMFLAPQTLGAKGTLLGQVPSSLALQQQSRGFKSRASTGIGRTRAQKSENSILEELKAKFASRSTLGFASGADRQSFSDVLKQHEQSPEVQGHLKVAFADGYATADANAGGSQPRNRFWTLLRGLGRLSLTAFLLLLIIQMFDAGGGGGIPGPGSLNMNEHEVNPEEVNVSFKDVKGVDEAKEELVEIVEFLKDPERFSSLGGRMPRGVLLVGKPGIGKTLLARAVAGEAGVPFFHASGSEFDEIFVGTGAKRVRQLFTAAKAKAPCVLFIDEIDTCGAKRTSSQLHPYANQTINQLLAEMDGFNRSEGVVVLGATNKRENLDPALLRPGRFDVEVQVWPPDLKGRTELFSHYLSQVKADTVEVSAEKLAKKTVGFLGAQIANVVNQAAIKAARDNAALITMIDLEWALDKERMGPEKKHKGTDDEALRRTASHEAGHTIVNYFTQHSDPINKVTIMPRGQTLGRLDMMQDREYDTTKGRLLARIDVALGGRLGEEMTLGREEVATGASSDFESATAIATQIVKAFGMSDAAGTRTYGEGRYLSEAAKELVDSEIRQLLDDGFKRAKGILEKHKTEHTKLTQALLKYETLDAEDVKAVIEGREPPNAAKKQTEKHTGLTVEKDIISKGLQATRTAANQLLPGPPDEVPKAPGSQ